MMRPFRFDRTWRFDVPVEQLWRAIADTSAYPTWWSWLRDYRAGPLAAGATASFRVRPPLPYTLRFGVTVDDVVERERVDVSVVGDVCGPATLEIGEVEGSSTARLVWSLELERPALARVEPVLRPVMVLGHNLVVAIGVRQFRRRALRAASR